MTVSISKRPGRTNTLAHKEQYLGQVREAFQFALLFVEAIVSRFPIWSCTVQTAHTGLLRLQDSLYNHSLNEAARRDAAKDQARVSRNTHPPRWSRTNSR